MAYNYLNKKKGNSNGLSNGCATTKQRAFVRTAPDETMHTAPGALYFIGGLGILAGFAANIWQMITTFTAFWSMFNPSGTPVDIQKQPVIVCICGLIAFSFQFALTMLTWRLDTAWKKHNFVSSGSTANAATDKAHALKQTAVEIVQYISLILIWGVLGFIVDTIGDYTFIGFYTQQLDVITQVFIIFIYAVSLYALSTIAFVRSVEYVTAGFAAARAILKEV